MRHRSADGVYKYQGVPIHAPPGVHEGVLALLLRHLPPSPGSRPRLVDLGAGHGAFTLRALEAGFEVDPVDFDAADWALSVPLLVRDLNEPDWNLPPRPLRCGRGGGGNRASGKSLPLSAQRQATAQAGRAAGIHHPQRSVGRIPAALRTAGPFRLLLPRRPVRRGHQAILPYWLLEDLLRKEGYRLLERRFIGRQALVFRPGRPFWKCLLVPPVDLLLILAGAGIPREAGLATNVAFAASPGGG